MRHLEPDQLLDEAAGSRSHPHLETCRRCREAVSAVRGALRALEDLREAGAPSVRLTRWAVAYAGCAAPAPARFRPLALLAAGAAAHNGIRDGSAAAAALYGDDEHQLDLRLEPGPHGPHLHGQVVSLDDGDPSSWSVVVVGPDGAVAEVASDPYGEFEVEGPAARWGATVIAQRAGNRLVVPRFDGWEAGRDDP